ncbi:MAG: L-serine ammonia-lyase, iron-sulfur-dependent, subunit alpha, partial [Muribaculaceae bacterium]|nr:L-serine ammonia-lyase, iron-sulfur-dependent, subunit alpha [Muribaculaceae bacterium]
TEEALYRATVLSYLVCMYIKEYSGKLSAFCGCGIAAPNGHHFIGLNASLDVLPQPVGDGLLVAVHLVLQLFYPVVVSHHALVCIG